MHRAKRIVRRLALSLTVILVTVATALGVLYGLVQTEAGRDPPPRCALRRAEQADLFRRSAPARLRKPLYSMFLLK